MGKELTILDKEYRNWIKELSAKYRKSQIRAAVKVNSEMLHSPRPEEQNSRAVTPQVVEQIENDIFSIPWGHHRTLIDKFKSEPQKALFYVHESLENGWSRDTLLNFIDSDLYARQGKALTNFKYTLPDTTSDLAQELTKDPYDFAFTGITEKYNERKQSAL